MITNKKEAGGKWTKLILHNAILYGRSTVLQYICNPEYSKGNKTIPEKVATTRTEDGHK